MRFRAVHFGRVSEIRVLHCVERMHTNAIESWLARMHHYAFCSGREVDWQFHVQFQDTGLLEQKYVELPDRVIRSRHTLSSPWRFFRDFHAVCRHGNYDVIHVHADIMSAPYLIAARLAGKAKLIVHVHNPDESVPVAGEFRKSLLRAIMRRVCLALADKIVGISHHTLDTFLRGRARRPGRDVVHYYGIDPEPFLKAKADRADFRRKLGLPLDALVLLFAGRLVPEKNPGFVLDVIGELRKLEPRTVGVFVGSGSEEKGLKNRALELGLGDSTRFLGWRNDIPEIMTCCDCFILPRPEKPMEGFGIAVVEAQLAGLRLLLSRGIPDDPILSGSVFCRMSLMEPPENWAREACSQLLQVPPTREEAASALSDSPMDMDRALADLLEIYRA